MCCGFFETAESLSACGAMIAIPRRDAGLIRSPLGQGRADDRLRRRWGAARRQKDEGCRGEGKKGGSTQGRKKTHWQEVAEN